MISFGTIMDKILLNSYLKLILFLGICNKSFIGCHNNSKYLIHKEKLKFQSKAMKFFSKYRYLNILLIKQQKNNSNKQVRDDSNLV